MKKFTTFSFMCVIALSASAQMSGGTSYLSNDTIYSPQSKYEYSQKYPNSATGDVMREGSGKTITGRDITKAPTQSINRLAATASRVESRDGEVPTIKAAPQSGTAYYLDGVRLNRPLR